MLVLCKVRWSSVVVSFPSDFFLKFFDWYGKHAVHGELWSKKRERKKCFPVGKTTYSGIMVVEFCAVSFLRGDCVSVVWEKREIGTLIIIP